MQVIFVAVVFAVAACVLLVFLAVPRLRRHALKAVAAVFGFAAGSIGSMFLSLVVYGFSGYMDKALPAWAAGAPGAILANVVFYGGGIVGAWLAVRITGWVQARRLRRGR